MNKRKSSKSPVRKGRTQFNHKIHQATTYLQANIAPVEDKSKLMCSPCNQELLCEGLASHLMTSKHRNTVSDKDFDSFRETLKYFNKSSDSSQIEPDPEEEAADQEMNLNANNLVLARFQMASFIVKNNLPFSVADNLWQFIQEINQSHTRRAQQSYSIRGKHISEVVSQTMLPLIQDKYLKRLEDTPFSISLDEGSPKTGEKYLAVSARYLETDQDTQAKTKLIDFVELTGSCTGEALKKIVDESLFSGPAGLKRRKNLMGISTDGASNMISSKGAGLTNRYKAETPYLAIVHDYCHTLNLVMKLCIKKFPPQYSDIIGTVSEVFRHSSTKAYRLAAPHQSGSRNKRQDPDCSEVCIPPVGLPFMSVSVVSSKSLSLFSRFFEEEGSETQRGWFTPENYKMLQLMSVLLGKISRFIKDFEKEDIDIVLVVKRLKLGVANVAEFLFDLKVQNTESQTPVAIETKFKRLSHLLDLSNSRDSEVYKSCLRSQEDFRSIFLQKHPNLQKVLEDTTENFKKAFYKEAEEFFHRAFEAFKQRLPLSNEIVMNLDCMLLCDTNTAFNSLWQLGSTFTNVISSHDFNEFLEEVMILESQAHEFQRVATLSRSSTLDFWNKEKDHFSLLYRLAAALQVLPYSTASVERNFSAMGVIKTLRRNQLGVKNLAGYLVIK